MLLRRYPLVVAAVAVGLVGLVLLLTPASWLVGWIISIFALLIAAREGFTMVRRLIKGEVGLDVLAVTAIVSTSRPGLTGRDTTGRPSSAKGEGT